jgi:hypothetical protein
LLRLRIKTAEESEAAVVPILVEIGIPESRAKKIAQRVVVAAMATHDPSDHSSN